LQAVSNSRNTSNHITADGNGIVVNSGRPAEWPFQHSPNSDVVNDPAIIDYIRQRILIRPSNKPYNLDNPGRADFSHGHYISKIVVPELLSNISVSMLTCMQLLTSSKFSSGQNMFAMCFLASH
jgi:hypothetical protein